MKPARRMADEPHVSAMRAKREWRTVADLWKRHPFLKNVGTADEFAKWCGVKRASDLDALDYSRVLNLPIMTKHEINLSGGMYRIATGENVALLSVRFRRSDRFMQFQGAGYSMQRATLAALATVWELAGLRQTYAKGKRRGR